eukprot:CAMPEP_0172899808 /NCGR_PEP_ID=MMETSP1075-20121228/162732_1 /TAXON_ID=2916 /ORGANISM="Ceratium fusus, Strain PA161109" /LENGTH=49 /DNA_ID= /DNA_START= /DNA_END= /DNA_ORIENTATION=
MSCGKWSLPDECRLQKCESPITIGSFQGAETTMDVFVVTAHVAVGTLTV